MAFPLSNLAFGQGCQKAKLSEPNCSARNVFVPYCTIIIFWNFFELRFFTEKNKTNFLIKFIFKSTFKNIFHKLENLALIVWLNFSKTVLFYKVYCKMNFNSFLEQVFKLMKNIIESTLNNQF